MKTKNGMLLVVLALAVVASGLTGCRNRSRRAAAQTPPLAAAPAPRIYSAPQPSYASVPGPTPAPRPMPAQPPTVISRRTIPAPSASGMMGSPDGPAAAPSFPRPAPAPMAQPGAMPMAPATPALVAVDRESAVKLDNEIVSLTESLRRLEGNLKNPPSAGPPADLAACPPAAASSGGGSEQARLFASQVKTRTNAEIHMDGNVVIVRMTDAFQPGSAKLKRDAGISTTLLATAEALSQRPAADVSVVGHSDSTPIKKSGWLNNRKLSEARAQTVATALSRHGVSASRMDVQGQGSAEPLVEERTAGDRAKNRRVEVLVRF